MTSKSLLLATLSLFFSINPLLAETDFSQNSSLKSENWSNNVHQLRDIQPTDWAYQALTNLVEQYGCIVGYPDQTFRGNRVLTRYEFVAGLNACLQNIEEKLSNFSQEDLDTVKKLTQDFEQELAQITAKIDNLENRVAFLEDTQFSTTTILNGEVIFAVSDAFGGDPPGGCSVGDDDNVNCLNPQEPATNTTFTHLTRLGLQTSFTGQDRLRLYLTSGNFDNGGFTNANSLNTYMTRLSHQAGLENNLVLDILEYRFPILDEKVVVSVIPFGFSLSSVLTANSPYFDIGRGSISRFGQLSPIFRVGGVLDAGVGFDWLISEKIRFQVAYGTASSGDPNEGLIGADHSALGVQLLLQPFESLVTGITYINSYNIDGRLGTFTGSVNAESGGLWSGGILPDSLTGLNPGIALGDFPAQTNAVGGTLQWRVTDQLTFGAWGGWTFTNFLKPIPNFQDLQNNSIGEKPFANTATYLFSLGLSDPFGREGDLFAFLVGMPPKLKDAGPVTRGNSVPFFEQVVRDEQAIQVTDNNPSLDIPNEEAFGKADQSTSLHFEFFYRFKVNDNIFITPGFFIVTNPGHIRDNNTVFVGTIRTTFRF
jgi:hypothetical protein